MVYTNRSPIAEGYVPPKRHRSPQKHIVTAFRGDMDRNYYPEYPGSGLVREGKMGDGLKRKSLDRLKRWAFSAPSQSARRFVLVLWFMVALGTVLGLFSHELEGLFKSW